jgi:NAD(P)-dependent dehydrogenase (short-subunit alcohol dehydrogenase family)
MQQELNGKVALITGSARRVGRAIMLGFARAGAHVVIHHSNSDDDAATAAEEARAIGVKATVIKADLNQYSAVERLFQTVKSEFGRLDVLVNSASVFEQNDFLDIPPDEWDTVMNVNLRAPFWCTQMAANHMRESRIAGSIINIADNSGLRPWAARPHHSISKAGLIMLTEVSARALAQYQIRVNAIVLGPVLPSPGQDEAAWAKVEARLPLQRSGSPDDAARAAVFLATNDFITGASLRVDGGEWLA